MEPVRIHDDKICILVLGDFLGAGSPPSETGEARWTPVLATPDSVMKLAGLRPLITLEGAPGGGRLAEDGAVAMELRSLESLDPGRIFQDHPGFASLRKARESAGREHSPSPAAGEEEAPRHQKPPPPEGSAELLEAILDVTQPGKEAPEPGSPEEIEAFAREVVRPHLVRDDSNEKDRVARVDEAISRQMSALIQSPPFQRMEAIWRSLVFLLSRVDSGGKTRVYLLHLPKEELEAALSPKDGPGAGSLRELLTSPRLGVPGRRWAVVVGGYDFAFTSRDIQLLAGIAEVARGADVPWISSLGTPEGGSEGEEDGGDDLPDAWQALREGPGAPWLGLTYPRFLLREPYGGEAKRVRAFDFQESTPSREAFLWGSGAFLAASLLVRALVAGESGGGGDPSLEASGVPQARIRRADGAEPASLEASLAPDDVKAFLELGIMPLFEAPGRASLRLGGIQSVSLPPSPLSGWWRGQQSRAR